MCEEVVAEHEVPWWLEWVLPVVASASAIGAIALWIGRKLLVPSLKEEIETMLAEKFAEAKEEVIERHRQNRLDIQKVERRMDDGMRDRASIQRDITEMKADISYLRGRTTGTFKRATPPSES
jgi:septal ring factor EnvC (AmiA/AmiB activator)